VVGGNFRIDELQAAVLAREIEIPGRMDGREAAQRGVLRRLLFADAGLGEKTAPRPAAVSRLSPHLQPIRRTGAEPGRASRARLTERGIGSEIYYPMPPAFAEVLRLLEPPAPGIFPQSERAAAENPGAAHLSGTQQGAIGARPLQRSPSFYA